MARGNLAGNTRRIKWLIALLVAANLLLVAVVGFLVLRTGENEPVQASLEKLSESMGNVYYRAEATLADGKINILLSNADENDCAIRAQLMLYEDGRLIGKTGWIDPGYRLENMQAQLNLQPGKYPCRMQIDLMNEDGFLVGSAGRALLLTVE